MDQAREPLLSREDERQLAFRIEAGVIAAAALESGVGPVRATPGELRQLLAEGQAARERFLLANVGLVWKLARRHARRSGLEAGELFQEGFVALVGALHRFDPKLGRFAGYATIRIERHLAEVAATRCGELDLPAGRALAVRQARGVAARVTQERGRVASASEVAGELGLPVAAARTLLAHRGAVRLDALTVELAEPEPVDFDAALLADQLRRLLSRLPGDQRKLLALRYGLESGEPMQQAPIAAQLGVSVRTVRRLEKRAMAALRLLAGTTEEASWAGLVRVA